MFVHLNNQYKKTILGLLALMLFSACQKEEKDLFTVSAASKTQVLEEEKEYLNFDEYPLLRSYILFKPAGMVPGAPLVFVLHGATQTYNWAYNNTGLKEQARIHKFGICYPQGTLSTSNSSHWNAHLTVSNTDDISFLTNLAQSLQEKHYFDAQRTFICGHSNGGFMSYTMACESNNVFRAIASVAGTMSGYTWNHCNPAQPVPILHIHGVNDGIVPIDGSMTTQNGWGGAPEVDSIIDYWATQNNCNTLDSTYFLPRTIAYKHGNGTNGHEVWYYKVNLFGHFWPHGQDSVGIDAGEVIWEFFSQY